MYALCAYIYIYIYHNADSSNIDINNNDNTHKTYTYIYIEREGGREGDKRESSAGRSPGCRSAAAAPSE